MASPGDSKAFAALKALLKRPFALDKTPKELFAPEEVYGEAMQDRAIAIVVATNVDLTLAHTIETHFAPLNSSERQGLFGPEAPIGKFSDRIKMGYALGIYGRRFRYDLDRVRHIRNAFTHVQTHVDFSTPEVKAACREIQILEHGDWGILGKPAADDAKAQYVWAAMKFCWHLYFSPDGRPVKLTDDQLYSGERAP